MLRVAGLTLFILSFSVFATETLHPVSAPANSIQVSGAFELNEDVYSADMALSAEISPVDFLSVYADASFRFLSYSYEYAIGGYIHNYCNLHVNGFNETYVGMKALAYHGIGLDVNWRFPPGEGSQENRFHRLMLSPFVTYSPWESLSLGTAFRYATFIESDNLKRGDEAGFKASLTWKFFQNKRNKSNWQLTEIFLFEKRIESSRNNNMKSPYSDMQDTYSGIKFKFSLVRNFRLCDFPLGIGLDYEIHKGTLFGFETGLRLEAFVQSQF